MFKSELLNVYQLDILTFNAIQEQQEIRSLSLKLEQKSAELDVQLRGNDGSNLTEVVKRLKTKQTHTNQRRMICVKMLIKSEVKIIQNVREQWLAKDKALRKGQKERLLLPT